jgi:hypothetical protein
MVAALRDDDLAGATRQASDKAKVEGGMLIAQRWIMMRRFR